MGIARSVFAAVLAALSFVAGFDGSNGSDG
jgi:hypothetical protein